MKIKSLDHLVLTVADVETTCRFYARVLGMEAVTFGEGRRALVFGEQKINLHQAGREFEPKAARPKPGSADLCFVAAGTMPALLAHLAACDIVLLEGPVARSGARGPMTSVYFRDPDLNLIEVSIYENTRSS